MNFYLDAAKASKTAAGAKGCDLEALRQGMKGGKLPEMLGDYRPALEMLIG